MIVGGVCSPNREMNNFRHLAMDELDTIICIRLDDLVLIVHINYL